MSQLYFELFINSLLGNFFLPAVSPWMMPVMIAFGTFGTKSVLIIGLAGRIAGCIFNYMIGSGIILMTTRKDGVVGEKYAMAKHWFNKVVFLMLPLCWLNIFIVLTFAAGIFRTRFIYFLPLVAIGEIWFCISEYNKIIGLPL